MTLDELKIDVPVLSKWLSKKKLVTILDIRPKHEHEEWAIPGSVHVDVYDKLKANKTDVFDDIQIPENVPIVTVCTGGRMSLVAAEQLKNKGHNVYSLEGGMKAWNFAWNTATLFVDDVTIIQIRRSAKGCLSYIIGSNNEAIVIDASLDPEVYLKIATDEGWKIRYVMDTHIHADYISRTRELAKNSGATHIMFDKAEVDYSFSRVNDGQIISFGNTQLEILHTPGHTLESTSFCVGGYALFTGDTLFTDGIGRPDLKADKDQAVEKSKLLHRSLQRLLSLPESTIILPAHTSKAVPFDDVPIAATIAALKEMDLLKLTQEEFVNYTLSRIPPTPPNYLTIAALNKKGSHEGYQLSDLEAGANRCAVV